jgi:glycosyltransferase involved in cell wall biosynthesis
METTTQQSAIPKGGEALATQPPAVSIILPTYNRAAFLPEALDAIRQQQWTDWELIVVDDGSTDDTADVVHKLTAHWPQPVQYIYQENQGAYGARNTGLDLARGRYIAFYDSDDLWLPHHLRECVEALEAHPEVDWVYGACRMVDHDSGRELAASTFYVDGRPRPFLKLRTRSAGKLRIIDDRRVIRCMIQHGLYCGLQDSVIRRRLFEGYRFDAKTRNEAEDQLIVIEALARGHRLAYLDQVHVVYRVHEGNSSATGRCADLRRAERIHRTLIAGFEQLAARNLLRGADRRALARRIADEYFWHLGYSLLWMHGRRDEALCCFRRAIAWWPWDWRYWKTLARAYMTPSRESAA